MGTPTWSESTPTQRSFTLVDDWNAGTSNGTADADVQAAGGIVLPPDPTGSTSTRGCTAADFSGFTAGDIALIQRGGCNYGVKVQNAEAAGASGVVIFNEGNPGRTSVISGSLLDANDQPFVPNIPVAFTSEGRLEAVLVARGHPDGSMRPAGAIEPGLRREAIAQREASLAKLPRRGRGSVIWYPGEVSVVGSCHGFSDGAVPTEGSRTSGHTRRPAAGDRAAAAQARTGFRGGSLGAWLARGTHVWFELDRAADHLSAGPAPSLPRGTSARYVASRGGAGARPMSNGRLGR